MKRSFIIATLLLPATLFAQKGEFTLKGKVGALDAPAKVLLRYRIGSEEKQDSAVLQHGAFKFTGTIDGPAQAMLMLKRDEQPPANGMRLIRPDAIIFYLEKGTITVNSPDSLYKATVSSPLNADNKRLQTALEPSSQKLQQLYKEMSGGEKPEGLEERIKAVREEEKQAYLAFIRANPKTIISLDALMRYTGGIPANTGELETLFNGLSANVKNSGKGKEFAALLKSWKSTAIGATAPVFMQNDTLGNPVSLSSFRGKYVLVDFWASWCGPCRAENPHVVEAYNKYKDKQFTVLGVSLDQPTGHDAWLKAIRKDGLAWTHVSDLKYWDNEVAKLYGVRSIPQNFLLDPEGKIIAKNLRGDALDKKLEEILQH